VFIC
jgi:hypothetical protein